MTYQTRFRYSVLACLITFSHRGELSEFYKNPLPRSLDFPPKSEYHKSDLALITTEC